MSESTVHVVLCLKQEESKYSRMCKLVMHLYCIVQYCCSGQGLMLSSILQTEMRKGERRILASNVPIKKEGEILENETQFLEV